jgi:hypothetical protein
MIRHLPSTSNHRPLAASIRIHMLYVLPQPYNSLRLAMTVPFESTLGFTPSCISCELAVGRLLRAASTFPASNTYLATSDFEKMAVANHPRRTCSATIVPPDTAIGAPSKMLVTNFQHVHINFQLLVLCPTNNTETSIQSSSSALR